MGGKSFGRMIRDLNMDFLLFFGNRGTNVVGVSPMDFFNFLFRDTMWGQIANQTNEYVLWRQQRLGPDAVARLEHPDYKRFACQNLRKPCQHRRHLSVCCSSHPSGTYQEAWTFWLLVTCKELTRTSHFSECTCWGTDSKSYWATSMWQMTKQIPPTLTHNINLWPNCSHSLICVIHSSKQHSILAKTFPSMKDAVHGEAIFSSNNLIHKNPISTTSKFFKSLTPKLDTWFISKCTQVWVHVSEMESPQMMGKITQQQKQSSRFVKMLVFLTRDIVFTWIPTLHLCHWHTNSSVGTHCAVVQHATLHWSATDVIWQTWFGQAETGSEMCPPIWSCAVLQVGTRQKQTREAEYKRGVHVDPQTCGWGAFQWQDSIWDRWTNLQTMCSCQQLP